MSKEKSIFSQQSPDLIRLFNHAERLEKLMCVPLDYAKATHVALCCNGQGTLLKNPFPVQNNPDGVDFLLQVVEGLCREHSIVRQQVFFGGEDCGTFADNFIHSLTLKGFPVFRVNAHQAKLQRENLKASTDALDLLGIAKVLLNRQGQRVRFDDLDQLQYLTRHRRLLVRNITALGNQIHAVVDQLCPGFLDEHKSGIPPFSEAALWLMSERFSPRQMAERKLKSLSEQLRRRGLHHPQEAAEQLKAFVRALLPPAPHRVEALQYIAANLVCIYKDYTDAVRDAERLIGREFARTSGALATTIRGTGIVLAAQLTAELGEVRDRKLKNLVSYSGIVPFVAQSGGPEQEAQTGGCPRRYNHIVKDVVMQLALHMGRHGPEELVRDYARREVNRQNKDFGIARRYLRIYSHLVREQCVYLPPHLRNGDSPEEARAYYLKNWPLWHRKWKRVDALDAAFDLKNPLGAWRDCIQSILKIDLPLNLKDQNADAKE